MATKEQLEKFQRLYQAVDFHLKSPQKIRSKVFNYIGFPPVSYQSDHFVACWEHFSTLPEELAKDKLRALENRVRDIAVYLDKISVFCKLPEEEFERVDKALSLMIDAGRHGIFNVCFPDVPRDLSLVEEEYDVFERLVSPGDFVKVYLAGRKRRYQQTFDIPLGDINERAVDDNVTLVKASARGLVSEASVDAFVLYKESKIVELRLSGAKLLSSQIRDDLVKYMNLFLKRICGVNVFGNAINFFPSIPPLYHETSDDCSVTRLGFLTLEGVGRQEKSARDKVDIRGEMYHMEGAKAIHHNFQLYGIRKKWVRQDKSATHELKLEVWGSSRIFSKPNPVIDSIFLLGAYRYEDYNFLMDKALSSLPSAST